MRHWLTAARMEACRPARRHCVRVVSLRVLPQLWKRVPNVLYLYFLSDGRVSETMTGNLNLAAPGTERNEWNMLLLLLT